MVQWYMNLPIFIQALSIVIISELTIAGALKNISLKKFNLAAINILLFIAISGYMFIRILQKLQIII